MRPVFLRLRGLRGDLLLLLFLLSKLLPTSVAAWTCPRDPAAAVAPPRSSAPAPRRAVLRRLSGAAAAATLVRPAAAYVPDPDPLREALYLVSRVQEATVQQERFVRNASRQEVLKGKMTLTLRLVEKNYRLLDQVTFCSEYVTPASEVVAATTAGYEAAEALQGAIDYVGTDLRRGDFEDGQKEFLTANLRECRERLFDFLGYMPPDPLAAARKRVEEENVANRDEFDGESDAGVYNPVVLPWKSR